MIDLALVWDNETGTADLVLAVGALQTHGGLRSAILISLFSDARADDDAGLPETGIDRGGWWGDAFGGDVSGVAPDWQTQNAIGSLRWLLRDGIASAVTVEVEAQGSEENWRRAIGVTLDRPSGPGRERYDFVWEASA